jgi:hypothetical protein
VANEALTESLQEAVLTALAFDVKHGALIAAQVNPEHFSGPYRDIATAVLNYRRRYHKPPGNTHLEQLFSAAQLDPGNKATHALRRTLISLSQQAEGLNGEYVASQTQGFIRHQKLGAALLEANERYVQGGEASTAETEGILHEALRFRETTLDAGTFLSEVGKSSAFTPKEDNFYALGIPPLDKLGIGLAPKQLLLYISPKNTGKSWLAVHAGRQALLQKAKVLHVTLEMSEQSCLDRYYQSFFGIATRPGNFNKVTFEIDELERLTGFKIRKSKPRLDFTDAAFTKILKKKVAHWGTRFNRLVIKEFPSGSLTMKQLTGYLDYLELVHQFVPNVLIIDYPDLFSIPIKDLRLALGRVFVDLRGLAGERNMALLAPTQGGRASIGAKRVSSTNVSEDISKVFTADIVLAYSQTTAEARLGLGRISVEHARNAPKGAVVLLSQAYTIGQFCLEAVPLSSMYWERLEAVGGTDDAPIIGDNEAEDDDAL